MNWKKVKLGDICDIKTGKFDANHSEENGEYPFFTCALIPFKCNTYSFNDEMLILPGNGANVGEVMYYKGKIEAYQRTYVVYNIQAHVKFLYYVFLKNWKKSLIGQQFGSATNYIRIDNLTKFPIPLPDLATQKHIAEVLDKANALRQQNRQLLTHYDELLQSTFIELFGDPVKNPKGWEVRKLGEVCEKVTDGTHQSPKFTENGIPFLFVSNIINNKIDYNAPRFISEDDFNILNKRTPIEIGNILYTIVGSYGNPAIIKEAKKFAFQRHIAFLKPNHNIIDYTFFHGQLQTNYIKNQVEKRVKGIAQKTLNLSELKEINLILPPLPLQQHFAKIVEQIEAQKAQAQDALVEREALFEGLLAGYFK